MSKNKIFFAAQFLLIMLFGLTSQSAQTAPDDKTLTVNKETTFVLRNKEVKKFYLNLKTGEFADVYWTDSLNRFPAFSIIAPSGKDIARGLYVTDSLPLIAPEGGKYELKIKFDEAEESLPDAKITLGYRNVFKMPQSARLKRQKRINGYDIKVYNTSGDEVKTFLLIEKNGKLKEILKGGSLVAGGFNFADDASLFDFAEGKKSAALMRTTLDKTGDGTPDVAVQFYTGGAHCCIDLHFYELGANQVRKVRTVAGMDSDVLAVGKKRDGSLILKTGDSNFAYWLTSFAGSPIPTVILSFQNGEFRPDLKLMKKPAPSSAVLKRKAAQLKKKMKLKPYTGEENSHFIYVFWDEMLDLMYAGNETAAWRYFDLIWDNKIGGKEKFKQDFLSRLNESRYWRMMQEDRNAVQTDR